MNTIDQIKTFYTISFRNRIFLFILSFAIVLLLFVAFFFNGVLTKTLEVEVGKRAMIQAMEISRDPSLFRAISKNDLPAIEKSLEHFFKITDANYIVIGDKNGVRLFHPDPEKIGFRMQGGDSLRALTDGGSYYTKKKGSLGSAIRGKSAIKNLEGNIIGVVSVGYLIDDVNSWFYVYLQPLILGFIITIVGAFTGSWLFSSHIKEHMLNMEPNEIALSLRLQSSILDSISEGVIAVNDLGIIISVNNNALEILGIPYFPKFLIGKNISNFVTPDPFLHIENNPKEKDQIVNINGETLLSNIVEIKLETAHLGWLTSFRKLDDLNMLTQQLSQVKAHSENLRIITHEHANKLSIIGGLIQIGKYDKALEIIRSQAIEKQKFIDYISMHFNSSLIAALLIGKYSKAHELGLVLEFDPMCFLNYKLTNLSMDRLATILGNLLDNAFEASLKNPDSDNIVYLLLNDQGKELVIEVTDNGLGIDSSLDQVLFHKGVTSKLDKNHGIGLYLVKSFVEKAGGTIIVENAEPMGTTFSIYIPNENEVTGSLTTN